MPVRYDSSPWAGSSRPSTSFVAASKRRCPDQGRARGTYNGISLLPRDA
jgi:hypothetical protein